MSGWQDIASAPRDGSTIIGAYGEGTDFVTFVTFFENNTWWLGRGGCAYREQVDNDPLWWVPFDYKGNPLKLPLPPLVLQSAISAARNHPQHDPAHRLSSCISDVAGVFHDGVCK